jgi:hypothetical protein
VDRSKEREIISKAESLQPSQEEAWRMLWRDEVLSRRRRKESPPQM